MPTPIRIAALGCALAALAVPASAKIERVIERTFTVQPGVSIDVTTSGGSIKVESSSDPVVRVLAKEHIRASSDAEADELLKKLDLKIEQSGNEVVAKAEYEHEMGFHWGSTPVEVEFEVRVPVSASARLKTSGGNIDVGDIQGTLRAHTSGGNLNLGDIGGVIEASTSGGNVSLGQGHSKTSLSTSGGNIDVDRIVGPAELKTSGGDIKVGAVDNTLYAQTSGGEVKASFEGLLKGDCSLSTSGGEVKVNVGKNAAFNLDAETSGGEVDATGLTITIRRGGARKSSLEGDVNGGGPELKLRSSGGDIKVTTG